MFLSANSQKTSWIKLFPRGFPDDGALEGWMFINHLALLVHHRMYALLKENHLICKYSVRDFIEFLADMKKVKING